MAASTPFLNPALIANYGAKPDLEQNNPLSLAEGVAKVRALQNQAQLAPIQQQQAQANLQSTQLQNQQTQQNQTNEQAFQKAIQGAGGDPDVLEQTALQYSKDPYTLARIQTMAGQMRERNATLTAKQQAAIGNTHVAYAGQLDAAINETDPVKKAAIWHDVATKASAEVDPVTGKPSFAPGQFDPNAVPDDATLAKYKGVVDQQGKYDLQKSKDKEEAAKAAAASIKADSARKASEREDIADMYRSVATPQDHDKFVADLQKKYPDIAAEYSNLPYDPDNTPDAINDMALTRKDSRQADYRDANAAARQTTADASTASAAARQTSADAAVARAKVAGGREGLYARANDPTLKGPEHDAAVQALQQYEESGGLTGGQKNVQQRYQERVVAADTKAHSDLEKQKQINQSLDTSYQSALRKSGVDQNTTDPDALNSDVQDPKTGKTITAGQAIAQMRAARAIAADQAVQQNQIEKRRGWGDYAPKQPAPAATATPAAPAPATTPKVSAPPASVLKEGVATKFKNGQTWTLRKGQPIQLQSNQ